MPLNYQQVDTFGPSREAFGQLQNALAGAPAFQANKLKLGAAQKDQQELRELQMLMAQTPPEQRQQTAIQWMESKGHIEEAAKFRAFRQELFDKLYERDPQAAAKHFPDLGVDPEAGMKVTTGPRIEGTRKFPARVGGGRTQIIEADKTQEELDAEARRRKLAELSVTPQTHRPGDVIDYPDPATGRSAYRETIPGQPVEVSPNASLAQPDAAGGYKTVYTAPGRSERATSAVELFQQDPEKARAFMTMDARIRSAYRLDRNPSVAEFMTDLYKKDPETFNGVFNRGGAEKAEDRMLRILQLSKDPITGEIDTGAVEKITRLLHAGSFATDRTLLLPSHGNVSPTTSRPVSSGRVRVMSPDGRTGSIPAEQLEDAKKSGYRIIQ